MKKIVLLAVAGIFGFQILYAQNPQSKPVSVGAAPTATLPEAKGNGKITGVIQYEKTNGPVEFASVALMHKASGKVLDGTITDGKGRFRIAGVAPGEYRLSIGFLGYQTQTVDHLTVGSGKDEVNAGVIALKSDAKALKEVSVVGEKPLIENQVDRLVYNAEKDINPGATAAEVMRKVPGLSVDLEGNLQLRGSSNIRVLINNKPSAVMANSVAEALLQIPAEQIKAVEVITSPSAKYDAEGTAGIINIITKKDNGLQGLTGNGFAAYGTLSSNVGGNLNYRRGKFGLNGALGYNLGKMHGENSLEAVYGPGSFISSLSQQLDGDREASNRYLQFGVDYGISKTSYLAAGVRLNSPESTIRSTQVSTSSFAAFPDETNTRQSTNRFDGSNYDLNLDYSKTFKKPGQELSVLGLLSRSTRNNENLMGLYEEFALTQNEWNFNNAYNKEITVQSDYTHPVRKTQQLEVGTKAILRSAESDYRFLVARPASSPFAMQPDRTDVFSYNQDVLASYATYGLRASGKYTLKLGVRYEHTKVQGDFKTKGTNVRQDYHNLFPSLSASKTLMKDRTIKFNYSKRIQRPQLFFLNPYENLSNPKNVVRGNPDLEAELTDSYEIGYSTLFKSGAAVNATVYWHQTNNSIQRYSTPYNGADPDSVGRVTTTFGNIGRSGNYGLSLSGNTKFLKKGRVSSNVNVFYTSVRSNSLEMANSGMMYNTNLNVSYSFDKGLSAQMAGEYNSPRVGLQGKTFSWATYNFAVRQEVLKKKGNVTLSLNNPFNRAVKQRRSLTTYSPENALVLAQNNTWYFYTRQIRVGFNYQFGKQDMKMKPRRIKKISNEDAKEGDGASEQ